MNATMNTAQRFATQGLDRRRFLLAAVACTGAIRAAQAIPTSARYSVFASGLRFPESPIPMRDGSVLLVEVGRGTLTRITQNGAAEVVATVGGGSNGAAIGPDGACYICNNGGFRWHEADGHLFPAGQAADYHGGRIERVDLTTGAVSVLYSQIEGRPLSAPNDLVFDGHGGFWFTDYGQSREHDQDHGGLYYARIDGSMIRQVVYPLTGPNGIALAADGKTVFVALTEPRLVFGYSIDGEGHIARGTGLFPGRVVASLGGLEFFDSMTIDADGNFLIATVVDGGIVTISPAGRRIRHLSLPDPITTSIRLGGLRRREAFITLGTTGRLLRMPWPTAGHAPQYEA